MIKRAFEIPDVLLDGIVFRSGLFGKKPVVPNLQRINLPAEQQAAITANEAAQPGAAKLANMTENQILQMMNQVMPGFSDITSQAGTNILSEEQGKIPTDVQAAIENSDAARALGGGFAGSSMQGDLVARDLGLTSLQLMDKGLSSAESWMSATEKLLAPAITNYESMFITPMQEYSTENEQNMQQFQRQWMQNQISAMPNPVARGIQDTTMEFIQSIRGGGQVQAPANGSQYAGTDSFGGGGVGGGGGGNFSDAYGNEYGWGGPNSSEMINFGTEGSVEGVDVPG